MHGKKREEYKAKMRDPKTAKVLAQKAEQWHVLMKELGGRRLKMNTSNGSNAETNATTLSLLGKALLVNPDPMNLWNHRRELIRHELQQTTATEDTTAEATTTKEQLQETIAQRERGLTGSALQRNPKAYGAWFHRKWILQTFRPSQGILKEELALTNQFLMADERNFHCWNYRRFVVACLGGFWDGQWKVRGLEDDDHQEAASFDATLMGQQVVEQAATPNDDDASSSQRIPAELMASEFEFTTSKIAHNFSNFSAFHYRSQLLDLCHTTAEDPSTSVLDAMEERLDTEFQLVEDAVCTEPDDQTCWWYHAILLDKMAVVDAKHATAGNSEPRLVERFRDRLEEQADLFREILEDSPDSKWVILGLFKVLQVLGTAALETESEDADEDESSLNSKEERDTLLQKLQQIDPYRSNRYEYLRN